MQWAMSCTYIWYQAGPVHCTVCKSKCGQKEKVLGDVYIGAAEQDSCSSEQIYLAADRCRVEADSKTELCLYSLPGGVILHFCSVDLKTLRYNSFLFLISQLVIFAQIAES